MISNLANNTFILVALIMLSASCSFEEAAEDPSSLFSGHKETAEIFKLNSSASGYYTTNDILQFAVTHPYNLTVTGTPRLSLEIGASTVYANYVSGSGGKTLIFRYTVQSGDSDSNGIDVAPTLDFNGGSIQYTKNSVLTNTTTNIDIDSLNNIYIKTSQPTITLVAPPTSKTYFKNQVINFIVTFSEAVEVAGTPQMELDVGGVTKYATYQTGSGSYIHYYSYTVVDGDDDTLDGVQVVTPLQLSGGSISDIYGLDADLNFTVPNTSTIFADGETPYVTSITKPTSGTYGPGGLINIVLNLSENVNVTGTPRIALTIGSNTRYANYLSGSGTSNLNFRYTVVPGDVDNNGIVMTSNSKIA